MKPNRKTAKSDTVPPPPPPAAAPAEPPPVNAAPLVANFTDLGHVRALPEVPAGPVVRLDDVAFVPGSIEQFADEDGRTMRIVGIGGVPHKYPAPEVVAEAAED